jgi:GntR family transcriptional regulator
MNGRVPRYHRIAEELRERIQSGELPPGARLTNQRQMAREFGVTLMTLRQGLEVLEREKLIRRQHGLGTFVAAPSIDYDILHHRRFAGDLLALGEPLTTRVLSSHLVLELERLRLVDGHPVSLQRSFLPETLGEELMKADLAATSLRQALEFKLGVAIERARENVSAVRLGQREARALGCPTGVPAFESERVSYTTDGQAIVFDRVFIPGDRFRITRELTYEGASA